MAALALPPLISSDGHLEVRPERWTPRMPARYRERAPRTVKLPDGGDALVVEGQAPYPAPFLDLRAGRTNETWHPFGATVDDTAGVGPPEQRLQEQDMDGLLAEVLFPNMQVGPRLWRGMADDDLYRATVRAYNDWLGEEYCPVSRDRLIGLGVIPWTSLDDAIAELHHCAKLGLRGVNLGVFPSGRSYPTPEDDRFWAEAIAMRMPLTVHVGFDRLGPRAAQPTFEYPGADPEVLKKVGPRRIVDWVALPFLGIAPALSMAQLTLSGVFDRLPDLAIFFAETRLGWVPFWMEEADYWYERHRHWSERLLGFRPPSSGPATTCAGTSSSACSTWSGWPSSCATTWAPATSCSRPTSRTSSATGPTRGRLPSGCSRGCRRNRRSGSRAATCWTSSTSGTRRSVGRRWPRRPDATEDTRCSTEGSGA